MEEIDFSMIHVVREGKKVKIPVRKATRDDIFMLALDDLSNHSGAQGPRVPRDPNEVNYRGDRRDSL